MAENFSEYTVIGNLGRDATTKTLSNGQLVTETTIAINSTNKGGEKRTKWLKVQIWGKRGQALAEYLTSGKLMFLTGDADAEAWEGENGTLRKQLVLNINPNDKLRFLGGTPAGTDTDAEPEENEIAF